MAASIFTPTQHDPSAFPDDALGTKMRGLCQELVDIVCIPSTIAGPIVLHAGIAHANPVANMVSPNGHAGPFGVNTMVSGVSGCGKSEAMRVAFGPMREFVEQAMAQDEVEGDDAGGMATHILNNATMPAIIDALAKYPVLNEIDDEFSSAMTGSMTRDANMRNLLNSGGPLSVARKSSGRQVMMAPHFTSLVLTQPHIRAQFDQKYGARLRSQGLATRTLFAEFTGSPHKLRLIEIGIDSWNANCDRLLDEWCAIYANRMQRRSVKFTPEGARLLECVRDEYQRRAEQSGDLAHLPEHAARQPENIQRIAAGMQVFEDQVGNIEAETVERAAVIGRWFTEQYITRFTVQPKVTAAEQYARTLFFELKQLVATSGQLEFELRPLLDTAPNIGLTAAQAKAGFEFLCRIGFAQYRTAAGKLIVMLSHNYFVFNPFARFAA